MMTVVEVRLKVAVGGMTPTRVPEKNSSTSRILSSSMVTSIQAVGWVGVRMKAPDWETKSPGAGTIIDNK